MSQTDETRSCIICTMYHKICEEEADNMQVVELQNRIKEIIDKETR